MSCYFYCVGFAAGLLFHHKDGELVMSRNEPHVEIDSTRLNERIHDIASIGATLNGGSNRQALTDEDAEARHVFMKWCENSACEVRVDSMGNIFARRHGSNPDADPILIGSHLDTQPTGGRFDGVYGVLAGLEVIESLNDSQIQTQAPIEVVVWTNEEGCRFDTPSMGSSVWAGLLSETHAYTQKDSRGQSVISELERIGFLGEIPTQPFPFRAAFEVHIEQGPVLEQQNTLIGIVTGTQQMSRHRLKIFGQEAHAGTTPMNMRRDPIRALSAMLPKFYSVADSHGPQSRLTFGQINCLPGAVNTVPGELEVRIDLRDPRPDIHDAIVNELSEIVERSCSDTGLEFAFEKYWEKPSVDFDTSCIASVKNAAMNCGYSSMEIISGALHDACNLSLHGPTSMIFIPCKDGLSHNEAEYADPDHLAAGGNVLLHAVLEHAL